MASGTKLADAYVNVIPSAEGIKGKLTKMFTGESDKAGAESGKSFVSSILKTVGGLAVAGVVVKGIKDSIDAAAGIEQSIGGIETLFKASSDKVINYADNAWKSCGLSANAYMETATSFSASLLQGLEGDTDAAAEAANRAIIDMSDNANKMGTSMQSIQNAYQGFAKQNYTMLDNLKLGYGGTKTEMQRLIADASKMTAEMELLGVSVDSSSMSFDNIVNAISVMQTHLGIAGTTALEAEGTITGSMASVSAAWQNVLANLGKGREQLSSSIEALVKSGITYVAGNLLPTILNIISTLPKAVMTVIEIGVPQLMQSGQEFIDGILGGVSASLPDAIERVGIVIGAMLEKFMKHLPEYMQKGADMILALIKGIGNGEPSILSAIGNVMVRLIATIARNLPQILSTGLDIIGQLVAGLLQAAPQVFDRMKSTLANFNWRQIGRDIVQGIINGLGSMLGSITSAASNLGSQALKAIKSKLGIHSPSRVFEDEVGKMVDLGLANGIEDNLGAVRNAMGELSNVSLGTFDTAYNGSMSFDRSTDETSAMMQILALLNTYLPRSAEQNIVLDSGVLVGQLASGMDRELGTLYAKRERGGSTW